jgi:multidrug efflux system membrane fusion protein
MDDQPTRVYVPPPSAPAPPASDEVRLPQTPPPDLDEFGTPIPPRRRSRLRGLLWLLLLAVIVGAVVWYVLRSGHQTAPAGRFANGGPMPVGTATVQKGDMPVIVNALGTVTPLATVTVKTQINGQLTEVAFQEGQMVSKGDFLAQIDPRPYQVALEQAQGQLAKDQASLVDAQLDLARYEKLVAQNSIARQQLDTQRAVVGQDQGSVQSDQAQIDAQKLNLAYCHIIAPVGGRVGLRQVDQGNYVQTSDANGLVVITQLQPISVIFSPPEDNLPAVLKQVHAGLKLQTVALDRSGANIIETGELATIDNEIDTTTGTVKMRANFANPQLALFPNQFVNIQLRVDTLKDVALVPSSAIQRGAPGTFVYLVKPDSTVTAQKVTLGPDDGTHVAVTDGLQPGQIIVTDGADRLKEGAKVIVAPAGTTPAQAPAAGAAPGAAQPAQPAAPGQPPASQSPAQPGEPRQPGQHRQSGNQ